MLFVLFEDIERKSDAALEVQNLFIKYKYDMSLINKESGTLIMKIETLMSDPKSIELDPESLSPDQTVDFVVNVF